MSAKKNKSAELPITYRGVVHPWQCDLMGHMNVVHYVSKFDDAAWQFFSMLGVDAGYFKKNHCGVAALEQHITYKSELHVGCTVTIRSGIVDTTEKVFRIRHEMYNNAMNELSAVMILTAVHFHTQKRKSCPFPKDIRTRAECFRI
ncbi:MAG TPA: thioesterase family protein [Bacteroidota bacterium]|nr:thioesterase family protein [Bacteroidota bacterium]